MFEAVKLNKSFSRLLKKTPEDSLVFIVLV